MLKKGSIAVACLAVATTAYWSWAATSWQLQTKVGTTGGSVQVRNNAPQTTTGIAFSNFTTSGNVQVTVHRQTGYVIKSVTKNGVAVAPTFGNNTTVVNFSKSSSAQTLIASFAPSAVSVPTSVVGPGTITTIGSVAYNSGAVITARPTHNYGVVTGVTVNGVADTTNSYPNSSAVTIRLSGITASTQVVATFAEATVSAGANLHASPGQTVTLNGSAQTIPGSTVAWSIVSAPTGSTAALADATGLQPTFTPVKEGTYIFQLSESVGGTVMASSTATLNVSASYGSTMDYFRASCNGCHNPNGVKATTAFNDFSSSTHWRNLRNNGDYNVAGDGAGSCATNKCHFNSVNAPGCYTCHSGNLQADGTFNSQAFNHTTQPQATAENTCMICHQGSHHGTPTAEYQKSAHYLNPYYQYGDKVVTCQDCHNPHSTKASFPSYDPNTYAETAAGACDACHVGPYNIFNADKSMKGSHASSKVAATAKNVGSTSTGWYTGTRNVYYNISSSFVTPNVTCTDCHGHNNYINAEYAETMHADKYGRWKGADYFKYRGYSSAAANPSNVGAQDGCVRCHTTTGFVNFVQSNFQDLRAWGFANTADKTAEVIACSACHVTGKGAITGEAEVGLPEGNPNGWNAASIRAYNKPFPAFYNFSIAKTGKFITSAQYRDFKESNVCISCHAGRNTATNGNLYKQLAGYANFTSLTVLGGSSTKALNPPHGVYQAAVLDAKLGYQFSGAAFVKYTAAANGHAFLGVNPTSGNAVGPCVACHMDNKTQTGENGKTATYRKHNFDIADANGALPALCSTCHSTSFAKADLDAANANFQASVYALFQFAASSSNKYGAPVIAFTYNGSYSLSPADAKRIVAGVSFTGKNADFADLSGAIYNMKLLMNIINGSEAGAYAHNPQYLKTLVSNTFTFLLPAGQSVATAITKLPVVAATTTGTVTPGFTADQQTAAGSYLNNVNNHYAAGAYKVQYMVGSSTCTSCHNPAETTLQAAARVAWAESDHGLTTGSAWMPGSSHLWRNAGDPKDFSVAIPASDCQRCHTADGFAQFADSKFKNVAAVDTAANAVANSPLNCNACHTDSNFARRAVVSVTGTAYGDGKNPTATQGVGVATFYNISTVDKVTKLTVKARVAANFPDVGESNMCNSCHSARLSGSALVTAVNNGLSLSNSGFQNSHYMGAAGMMYMKAGFTAFTSASAVIGTSTYGKSLTSSLDLSGGVTSTHRNLGTVAMRGDSHNPAFFVAGNLDTNGPCVTCHMQGYNNAGTKRSDAGHSLGITQETITQVCNNCHSTEAGNDITTIASFQQHFLEPQSEVFQNALSLATQLLLQNYNISYNSASYPYFYDESLPLKNGAKQAVTDWTRGGVLSNAAALKLEGACFNINLLSREPAAYVHARSYTRRLVYDTIDFLDDGVINNSTIASAIATMPAVYGKGATAYTDGTLTTLASGTTESMIFLAGWSRTTGAWNSPIRP